MNDICKIPVNTIMFTYTGKPLANIRDMLFVSTLHNALNLISICDRPSEKGPYAPPRRFRVYYLIL